MKQTKPTISKLNIPFELNQQNCSVELKKWTGDNEVRFDLCFRTSNSYVSHSLSRQQLVLLKKCVNEFKF